MVYLLTYRYMHVHVHVCTCMCTVCECVIFGCVMCTEVNLECPWMLAYDCRYISYTYTWPMYKTYMVMCTFVTYTHISYNLSTIGKHFRCLPEILACCDYLWWSWHFFNSTNVNVSKLELPTYMLSPFQFSVESERRGEREWGEGEERERERGMGRGNI